MRIWNTYGKFAALALRNRTHWEDPWRSAFEHSRSDLVIPQDSMRDFFADAAA